MNAFYSEFPLFTNSLISLNREMRRWAVIQYTEAIHISCSRIQMILMILRSLLSLLPEENGYNSETSLGLFNCHANTCCLQCFSLHTSGNAVLNTKQEVNMNLYRRHFEDKVPEGT